MMGPILRIHHTAPSTPDLDRLLGFYRDLLGFEVVLDTGWPEGTPVADAVTGLQGSSARQVMLCTANGYLELFQYHSPAPAPRDPRRPVCDHGITHISVDTDDLDAEYARLVSAGVTFHSAPQVVARGVRTCYARDPDGNVVEVQELAPEHPLAMRASHAAGA